MRFRWRHVLHEVAHVEGPERIDPNGGATRRSNAHARLLSRRKPRGAARLLVGAWPKPQKKDEEQDQLQPYVLGLWMARSHEQYRRVREKRKHAGRTNLFGCCLCRACRHHQLLVSARRVTPEELVRQAALGMTGIGIADRNTVAGMVRGYTGEDIQRPRNVKIRTVQMKTVWKLIVGAGSVSRTAHPTSSPTGRPARLGRLTRLLTVGKSRGEKAECDSLSRRSHRAHRGSQSHRDAAGRIKTNAIGRCAAQIKSIADPPTRMARGRVLYRGDDADASPPQDDCRTHVRPGHRDERWGLPRARNDGNCRT